MIKKKKFEKQINDENILWENNFRSKIRKNKVNTFLFFFFFLIYTYFFLYYKSATLIYLFSSSFPSTDMNIYLFID